MTKLLTSSVDITTDSLRGRCSIAWMRAAYVAIAVASAAACVPGDDEQSGPPQMTVTAALPDDIPGGAPMASLEEAATFAWQEFIALSWPAAERGVPDTAARLGDPGPVVWESYRNKVEVFPGTGVPTGDYNLPPRYMYNDAVVGTYPDPRVGKGGVPSCSGTEASSAPLVNLDEASQIGFNHAFARPVGDPDKGSQILFAAKINPVEFDYIYANKWFLAGIAPFSQTAASVLALQRSALPGSSSLVSFPGGTIEIKAAWRRLTAVEAASGRFYSAPIRFYRSQDARRSYGGGTGGDATKTCYVDEPEGAWGLVGLHIIHKTPSAPYFTYATFEQADNILDATGAPLEDPAGQIVGTPARAPFEPDITSINATGGAIATPASVQTLIATPTGDPSSYGLDFFESPSAPSTPQGRIHVNQRKNPIPSTIIAANRAAQAAVRRYSPAAPWQYYRLVNVQYRPFSKPTPGKDYVGEDRATYYTANIVIESDYDLQMFSGSFQQGTQNSANVVVSLTDPVQEKDINNLITDFSLDGSEYRNMKYEGITYNMGGCMGCHGNVQAVGSDFSFLLFKGSVDSPSPIMVPVDGSGPAVTGRPASRRGLQYGLQREPAGLLQQLRR
jgi:hypothetical protein